MTQTLSIIDVSGVQRFIFGSNKLKEQIGASALVRQLTETWIRGTIAAHSGTVIVAGGGNVLFESTSIDTAKQVVRQASTTALTRTPGLDLYAAHVQLTDGLAVGGPRGAYTHLFQELGRQKQYRRSSDMAYGWGVTAECAATGAPAVAYDSDEGRVISAELVAKLVGTQQAQSYLERLLETIPDRERFTVPTDFDDLGRTAGEQSQIAIVHADGNGFGQRFRGLVEQAHFADPAQNDACLMALRELSDAIEKAGRTALQQTVAWVIGHLLTKITAQRDPTDPLSRFVHDLSRDGASALPLRPLLFGGDDLTFVCDGRLGLPLAARYLHEFEIAARNLPFGGPGYASAGVAIVRSHYPFARAYALCEQLCKSAKDVQRDVKHSGSALDWHVAQSGLAGSLAEIRAREFKRGTLLQRPLTLHPETSLQEWRSWAAFAEIVRAFNHKAEPGKKLEWGDRRNKLIPLRDEIRGGPTQTRDYRAQFGLPELPEFSGHTTIPQARTDGWHDGRAVYFDAIEAIDLLLINESLPQREEHA